MKKTVFLMASLFLGVTIAAREVTSAELLRTEPDSILRMYQLMKDVHELFFLHNIKYWAAGGTLLGAVRHQGIIPWDVDLDIFIDQDDEKKLLNLSTFFSNLNYVLFKKREYVYKLYPKEYPKDHIDIILTYQEDNKIFYSCKNLQKAYRRDGLPLYFTNEELYPLRLSKFGLFNVVIANNPHPYLFYAYGSNYLTHAHDSILQKVLLLEADRVPAQPMGPLKNRVQS